MALTQPGLRLTLSRQTLFLIPLVLVFSDIVTTWFLQREIRNLR